MFRKSFVLMIAAVLLFCGFHQTLAGKTLVIKGSTTVLPIAQSAVEAYMKMNPSVNISLSGGGSGDGIKALIDKTTDIANSSRDIKKEEIEMARSKGVNPVTHKVAIDAIVPVVHPRNPVKDLTIEQLSLIYQGKITNWKEVGGKDLTIIVVSRDTSSGTYESWEKKVLSGAKVTPKAQLQASNGAVVQAVSKNKYAIGYIGLGYLNKSLKGLKVNGVQASAKTALSGEYPVARPLFMFTDGAPTGEAANFINFLLGPQGQKIVKKEGFVPLR
jgi:phosphate transport system substrate-binding protein